VQGHIDGVAVVRAVVAEGGSRRVTFDAAPELRRYIVEKGSVCLDGVSLTVSAVDDSGFEVALIPHTLQVTSLGTVVGGDRVNVELDVIAKYVERLVR
jgi:riboflavin synthase